MNEKPTPREWQIMSLVVLGKTKIEIAEEINRSFHTVNKYYRQLYEKLHIRKETELVREWFILKYGLCRNELMQLLAHPEIPWEEVLINSPHCKTCQLREFCKYKTCGNDKKFHC